jgi:hypothetical protein
MATDFDPYRKWLGIPKNRRPPSHYNILGIDLNEDDPEVIQSAADQRRNFVDNQRGLGHDRDVKELLSRIDEATITLLDPKMRRDYDRRLKLFQKRKRSRRVDPNAPRSRVSSKPGRVVGEGGGWFGTYVKIVLFLAACFAAMAWFSFQLPWNEENQGDRAARDPAAAPAADVEPAVPPNQPPDETEAGVKPEPEKVASSDTNALKPPPPDLDKRPEKIKEPTAASKAQAVGLIRTFSGHTDLVGSATFSPDGTRIASSCKAKSVRLWDTKSGKEIWTYSSLTSSALCVRFSSGGDKVLVGSRSECITLNATSGNLVGSFALPSRHFLWRFRTTSGFISMRPIEDVWFTSSKHQLM